MNLTAITDPAQAWERLVVESLRLLDAHAFAGGEAIVDIGSGAGIPGIPLAIALPAATVVLVEADQKKAAFLRDAASELGLERVAVEARRAEDLGRDAAHRERYDVAVTRAAAPAPVAAEYSLPLVRVGGWLLAQARPADWAAARGAVEALGGRPRGVREGVVVVEKTRPTPAPYPRRAGLPAKRPLR